MKIFQTKYSVVVATEIVEQFGIKSLVSHRVSNMKSLLSDIKIYTSLFNTTTITTEKIHLKNKQNLLSSP